MNLLNNVGLVVCALTCLSSLAVHFFSYNSGLFQNFHCVSFPWEVKNLGVEILKAKCIRPRRILLLRKLFLNEIKNKIFV